MALTTADIAKQKEIWIGSVSVLVLLAIVLSWIALSDPLTKTPWIQSFLSATSSAPTSTPAEPNVAKEKSPVTQTTRKQDVVTIIRGLKNVSMFNTYFRSSGVAATINPKSVSQYTIFVPTNGAFAQLPVGTVGNMSAEERQRLIRYHVVSGRAVDAGAMTSGSIQALSGDMLNFNRAMDDIPMVNSALVVGEYRGTNGVVILIDNVLLPPKTVQ